MDRETFMNELLNKRRRQHLATLMPLGKAVLRAKILAARLAQEEGRCEELQTAK